MKTFVYIANGNSIKRIDCESFKDAERFCGHGNVFCTREEADKVLALRNKPKTRLLSATEIEEQNEWAREQMTEEDRALVRTEKRNVDYEQFLFAMKQMGIYGPEFQKRKDAFWNRYNANRNYRKSYA